MTLSTTTMGAIALAVLWVNVLLVVADALRRWARLGERLRELRRARAAGALVTGEIVEGAGPDGVLAVCTLEQTGRAMTVPGPQRILFTDRARHAELLGGRVRVGEELVSIEPTDAEVWCPPAALLDSRGDASAFETAWAPASTFKGFATTLARRLGKGDRIWLELSSAPREGRARARLVALEDPERVVARARGPLVLLAGGAGIGLAVVTLLALWPPALGAVSMLGGALGLALFLGIPPLGTAARDRALLPSQQSVGGTWQRP